MGDQLLCNADDEHYNGVPTHIYYIYMYVHRSRTDEYSPLLAWNSVEHAGKAAAAFASVSCDNKYWLGGDSKYLSTYVPLATTLQRPRLDIACTWE